VGKVCKKRTETDGFSSKWDMKLTRLTGGGKNGTNGAVNQHGPCLPSFSLAILYHDFDELQQKKFSGTGTGGGKSRHK